MEDKIFKQQVEYKELLKEQKEKRQELIKELKIKKIISDKTLMPFSVYITDLWGLDADIEFKRDDGVNKQELLKLLDLFKPIKMFLVGGNSFKFKVKDENETFKEINPYIIEFRSLEGYSDKVLIKWFSEQKGLFLEITAIIKDYSFINEFCEVTAERKEYKGGFRYENIEIHLNGNFADGQYKTIRWGRGTEQQKNDFTIYTENLETDFKDYIKT